MKISFSKDAEADIDAMATILQAIENWNVKVKYKVPPTRGMVIVEGQLLTCDNEGLGLLTDDDKEIDISYGDVVEIEIQ